jgi:hypothetical protein
LARLKVQGREHSGPREDGPKLQGGLLFSSTGCVIESMA